MQESKLDFSNQAYALVHASNELRSYAGFLTTEEQKEQAQVAGNFRKLCNLLAYDLLQRSPSPAVAEGRMDEAFSALLSEGADDWNDCVEVVREDVRARIRSESRKSPALRRIIRWTPVAIIVFLIAAYFGVRQYNLLTIDQPLESVAGIQQRAAAAQKAARYDDMSGGRGGMIKGLLMWPFEPNEEEAAAARDFASTVLNVHDGLRDDGVICSTLAVAQGQPIPNRAVDMIEEVADSVRASNAGSVEDLLPAFTTPILARYPCAQVPPTLPAAPQ